MTEDSAKPRIDVKFVNSVITGARKDNIHIAGGNNVTLDLYNTEVSDAGRNNIFVGEANSLVEKPSDQQQTTNDAKTWKDTKIGQISVAVIAGLIVTGLLATLRLIF